MNLTEWLAILGALAWMPPLFTLFKTFLNKTEIRIITSRTVSLGFTSLGPIFNLHLAFSVKNKDIVISDLKVKLLHESGEERLFVWESIKQQVIKMQNPDGTTLPYEKEPYVLAIKLLEINIEERFILFQEKVFHQYKEKIEEELLKDIIYLKSQNKYFPEDFLSSQKMMGLLNYTNRSFPWKTGAYKVYINLESPEKFKLIDSEYEFTLTDIDVEELSKNKEYMMLDYKNLLVPQSKEEFNPVNWNWRNPLLRKVT